MLSVYEKKARLTPGLLGIAPVTITVTALGLKPIPVVAVLAGVLVTAGGTYALALLVARLGRQAQLGLWRRWGGSATLQMLQTRGSATNATQREIWRAGIARYTGVALLSEADECAEPQQADDAINAAVGQCLPLGHGGEQGKTLVAAENAQYGFERNVYAFRWYGRATAAMCIMALVVALVASRNVSPSWVISGIVINTGFLLFWALAPSEARTRAASERYATQLLDAVAAESRKV